MNILELFARIGLDTDQDKAQKFLDTTNDIKSSLRQSTMGSDQFSKSAKAMGSNMKGAQKNISGVNTEFLMMLKSIKGIIVASGTLAAAVGIKRVISDAMNASVAYEQFSAETGASIKELQRWKAVADQVSGSGDAVAESIKAITLNQAKIRLGQGNISGYQLLGIDPRQDPFEILKQIREKTRNMSAGMKRDVLSQIGVSPELVATLNLTNKQFDAMASRAFIIPESAIKGMDKARASLQILKNGFEYFKALLVSKLSPTIDKITTNIARWFEKNKDKIINFFQKGANVIEKVIRFVSGAVGGLNALITSTTGWKAAIIGIVGALALMNAQFLASPLGIFTAAIVILMLLLEDFYGYTQGKDSVIGRLIEQFPGLKKIFEGVGDALKAIVEGVKAVFSGDYSKLDAITKKWGLWGDAINLVFQWLGFLKEAVVSFFTGDFSKLDDLKNKFGLIGKVVAGLDKVFYTIKEAILAILTGDFSKLDELGNKWGIVKQVIEPLAEKLNLIKTAMTTLLDDSVTGATKFDQLAQHFGIFGKVVENTAIFIDYIISAVKRLLGDKNAFNDFWNRWGEWSKRPGVLQTVLKFIPDKKQLQDVENRLGSTEVPIENKPEEKPKGSLIPSGNDLTAFEKKMNLQKGISDFDNWTSFIQTLSKASTWEQLFFKGKHLSNIFDNLQIPDFSKKMISGLGQIINKPILTPQMATAGVVSKTVQGNQSWYISPSIKIDIDGSQSPEATGQAVKKEVQGAVEDLFINAQGQLTNAKSESAPRPVPRGGGR